MSLRQNYRQKPLPISLNGSDTAFGLTLADTPQSTVVRLTNLVLSAGAAGTIIFLSNTTEIWRWTFPSGQLLLELGYNPDGWGPPTLKGEQLRLSNSGGLALTGCGNYYYL